jgi:hypothetical protein
VNESLQTWTTAIQTSTFIYTVWRTITEWRHLSHPISVFSAFEDQLINVIISNFSFYVEFPCSSLLNTFCLWRQWAEWTPNWVRRQNTDNEKKSQRAIITHKCVLKPNLLVRAINRMMHEGIINPRVIFFQEMEYNTLLYFIFCKTKASVCFCLHRWS